MTLCMLEVSFRHVQSDGLKARPGLLNEIEESPGAATNIKKPQFALIVSSKSLMELRQCLASNGVGRTRSEVPRLGCRIFQPNRRSSSRPTENGNFANSRRAAFHAFPCSRLRCMPGARGVDGCLEDPRRRAASDGSMLREIH